MKDDIPWILLARYFAGELSIQEKKKFENWIKKDPKRKVEIEQIRLYWERNIPKSESNLPDTDRAWDKLNAAIISQENSSEKEFKDNILFLRKEYQQSINRDHLSYASNRFFKYGIVAATFMVAILTGYLTYQYNVTDEETASTEVNSRILLTKNGERATYRLSDGSRITLHAGSKLEIPEDFNQTERRLKIEGEAYFDVQHDITKPFFVESGETYTQVLGTKFLVQAWENSGIQTNVVVEEGKVRFGNINYQYDMDSTQQIHLSKNQRGKIDEQGNFIIEDNVDLSWYIGWMDGRLVFNDKSLNEILPKLERWYDIEINVSNEEFLNEKVTAEIDYSLSMSEVMNGLAMTLNMDIEQEGRQFLLTSLQ